MKMKILLFFSILLSGAVHACGTSDAEKELFYKYVNKVSIIDGELSDSKKQCDEIIFYVKKRSETGSMNLASMTIELISPNKEIVVAKFGATISTEAFGDSRISTACINRENFAASNIILNLIYKPIETKNQDGTTTVQSLACVESKKIQGLEFLREKS